MLPKSQGIDHIHINVSNRTESERWYKEVLGFVRVKNLEFWSRDGGPLTLRNQEDNIHLALFELVTIQNTVIAIKTTAVGLTEWITHLGKNGLEVKPVDHDVSWSIYFCDPDGNPFEITTYDYMAFKSKAL